ncbi:MAG: HAD-IIA family hydrolase [Caulobacteraceae bacterium]|nr:HAD-IIA family hydrolase [Caulobacteraceae bacterium]
MLCDWDGCLALQDRLVPGVLDFVSDLHGIVIVSNNSTLTANAFHALAVAQGLRLRPQDIHLAGQALIDEAVRRLPNRSAWVIGTADMRAAAETAGLRLTKQNPDALLVLRDPGFDYDKLTLAAELLRRGAAFWVSNMDDVHPVAGGFVPETGALVAAIHAASGRRPDFVAGKPQPFLFRRALDAAGAMARECLMIGDNPRTDIAGARRLSLPALYVGVETWLGAE